MGKRFVFWLMKVESVTSQRDSFMEWKVLYFWYDNFENDVFKVPSQNVTYLDLFSKLSYKKHVDAVSKFSK